MRDYSDYAMKQKEFFKAFSNGGDRLKGTGQPLMLKVKDYPPEAAFAEEMPRHWQVSLHTDHWRDIFLFSACYLIKNSALHILTCCPTLRLQQQKQKLTSHNEAGWVVLCSLRLLLLQNWVTLVSIILPVSAADVNVQSDAYIAA